MYPTRLLSSFIAAALIAPAFAAAPKLAGIGAAMLEKIDQKEIAGAVTVVMTKDKIVHLEASAPAPCARPTKAYRRCSRPAPSVTAVRGARKSGSIP